MIDKLKLWKISMISWAASCANKNVCTWQKCLCAKLCSHSIGELDNCWATFKSSGRSRLWRRLSSTLRETDNGQIIFDLVTAHEFYAMQVEDFDDFMAEPHSAR